MIGLNNKKIGFIVDSSSNLKNGQFEDVQVVPLGISIQSGTNIKSYKDGIDFYENDLIQALNNKTNVKTSQAAMPDMMKIADEMCSEYDIVFVLPIHNRLSGNINSWKLLKDEFTNLNVVMTYDISVSFAWTIEQIKNYLKTNDPIETDVQKFVDEHIVLNRCGFLMVEDLEQLKKGGRVNTVKAILAKLFKIKPVILFDQNGLTNYDKAKDYLDLFDILDKHIKENYPGKKIAKFILFTPYGNEQTKSNFLADYLSHYDSIPYELSNLPTVVVCHTGLKYVGVYIEMK